MSRDIWVLRKSGYIAALDGAEHPDWYDQNTTWAYSSFGAAREAFRKLIRSYALTKSNLFDGDGNILGFQEYFDRVRDEIAGYDAESDLNRKESSRVHIEKRGHRFMAGDLDAASSTPSNLRNWLLDTTLWENPLPEFKWTDWMAGIASGPDALVMEPLFWNDLEYFDPELQVSSFSMADPNKCYIFRIENVFESGVVTGGLRISLCKVSLDGMLGSPEPKELHGACFLSTGGIISDYLGVGVYAPKVPIDDGTVPDERALSDFKAFISSTMRRLEEIGCEIDRRIWLPATTTFTAPIMMAVGVWTHSDMRP